MIGFNKITKILPAGRQGFTLVELIVVITALLFVLGTAVGIFISIVQHQRVILAEQELLNQFSYAIDHMSKALRMSGKALDSTCMLAGAGSNYELTRSNLDTGTYNGIKFINQSDDDACQEFYLDGGILKEIKNGLPSEGIPLTSNKFYINKIRFGINGCDGKPSCVRVAEEADNTQLRITIYLDVQIIGNDDRPSKKIQTTISQRNLNVQ